MLKPVHLAALCLLLGAGQALADPRLDEVVYDPYVLKGVGELEVRTAREAGGALGGEQTTVIEGEYGVSDRLRLAVLGAVAHAPGEGTHLDAVGIEAIAYIGQIPKLGVDTGVYVEYDKGLNGSSDGLEAKLLLAKTQGRFQGLLNLIVEEPLGAPRGEQYAAYGYAASATWRTVGKLRLGVEAFGDFGDDHRFLGRQGAYVGPQVKWSAHPRHSPVEIEVDAGWLGAVGPDRHEANSQVRLTVEFERRF